MKHVLMFNTDNEGDQQELTTMLQATAMASLLWDIEQELLRPARKHGYVDPKMQELLVKIPDGLGEELIWRLEELYYEAKNNHNIVL